MNIRSVFQEVVVLLPSPLTFLLLFLQVRVVGRGSGGRVGAVSPLLLPHLSHLLALLTPVAVALKELLHAFLPQQQSVLVFVFFFARRRYLVPIIVAEQHVGRHKRGGYVFLEQLDPGETFEPGMLLDFDDAVLGP